MEAETGHSERGIGDGRHSGVCSGAMNWKRPFVGDQGLRAGWRLAVWFAILYGLTRLIDLVIILAFHPGEHAFLDPLRLSIEDIIGFVAALVATIIMARVERRTFRDYYIPARGMFARQFWLGILWGLLAVSLLIGMIGAAGGYKILGVAMSGNALVHWTLLWIGTALVIGVVEEFTFRAYMLRTLADGIGFWPAAILLSAAFGALHYFTKPYERWEDFASTGLLGLFMCLTIRRTGTIAFAVGWHAAFDWGAIYFYSGRNAGEYALGHLLKTSWPGSNRVTGGMLGPEASWFVFVVIAVLFAAFALAYSDRRQIRTSTESGNLHCGGS